MAKPVPVKADSRAVHQLSPAVNGRSSRLTVRRFRRTVKRAIRPREGAFTGAIMQKVAVSSWPIRGPCFLDEVEAARAATETARAAEQEFGAGSTRTCSGRALIAATNHDLGKWPPRTSSIGSILPRCV